MTTATFCASFFSGKFILQRITNGFIRSGYSRAAHELDSAGMHAEAKKLRNDARLVGGN